MADWARLQAVRDAVSFVDAAKRSPVGALMENLSPGLPIHAVEAALRGHWRDAVGQVAKWHRGNDRAAISWMSLLADLPAIAYLASRGAVLDWMVVDRSLAPYVAAASGEADALSPGPDTAVFAPAFSGAATVWECWLARWKSLWPPERRERAAIGRLVRNVTDMATGQGDGAFAMPGPDALDRVFEVAYRKHPRSLVASIAWLGMTANDLRRLRGQVVARLALPSRHRQGGTG